MQFSYAAVAAIMATAVSANYNTSSPVWVTDVVTAYTTYCPFATEVTLGGKTYTVTEATTLTITDCPCTISKPAYVTPVVTVSPVYPNATAPGAPAAVAPTGGATGAPIPVGTGSVTAPAGPAFTGAATKAAAGSAAGLAALMAVVAYAL